MLVLGSVNNFKNQHPATQLHKHPQTIQSLTPLLFVIWFHPKNVAFLQVVFHKQKSLILVFPLYSQKRAAVVFHRSGHWLPPFLPPGISYGTSSTASSQVGAMDKQEMKSPWTCNRCPAFFWRGRPGVRITIRIALYTTTNIDIIHINIF